jgi:hypothetical protein
MVKHRLKSSYIFGRELFALRLGLIALNHTNALIWGHLLPQHVPLNVLHQVTQIMRYQEAEAFLHENLRLCTQV